MKKVFLFIFLSYWIFFFLFPPFQNPDEQGHFETTFWLSTGKYPFVSPEFIVLHHPYGADLGIFFNTTIQHAMVIPNYKGIQKSDLIKKTTYTKNELSQLQPLSNQAYNPPLYYAVAAFFLVSAKLLHANLLTQFYITRISSAVFYFASVFIAYKILSLLFKKPSVTKGLLLAFSLNPLLIQSGIGISPDIAVAFWSMVFFYVVLRMYTYIFSTKVVIFLGCIAGVAALTKISALFLIPSFVLYLFLASKRKVNALKYSLVFCLIFFITQLPWLLFNYSRYHKVTVESIALGIPPSKTFLVSIPYAVFTVIFDLRHTFMHYAGFVGWNESFPFSFLFIPFTLLFILFSLMGIVQKIKPAFLFFKLSTIFLFLFFFCLGFARALYYHPGWGIGGRNILPIFLPLVLFTYFGLKIIFKNEEKLAQILSYVSIFYYFVAIILVLIPRYYV